MYTARERVHLVRLYMYMYFNAAEKEYKCIPVSWCAVCVGGSSSALIRLSRTLLPRFIYNTDRAHRLDGLHRTLILFANH